MVSDHAQLQADRQYLGAGAGRRSSGLQCDTGHELFQKPSLGTGGGGTGGWSGTMADLGVHLCASCKAQHSHDYAVYDCGLLE